jgi:hypothetical protein
MDQIIGKLGVNLDNGNTAIKKFTLQTLQNIGLGRNDVLMLILPKLVDQDVCIVITEILITFIQPFHYYYFIKYFTQLYKINFSYKMRLKF